MRRAIPFLLFLFFSSTVAQEKNYKEIFDPFTAHWKGVFKVYNYDGRLLDELQVEQRYWWEGGVQHAEFLDRYRDGRTVRAKARNYEKDGVMYCEVEKETGEKTVHRGHFEDSALFWYHKNADGSKIESFKERVIEDSTGKVYYIDGFGVYGKGESASYLIFEGCYREVKK